MNFKGQSTKRSILFNGFWKTKMRVDYELWKIIDKKYPISFKE